MQALLGASWKTSILGWIVGIGTVLWPIIESGRSPTPQEIVAAIVAVIGGRLVKDYDQSGSRMRIP